MKLFSILFLPLLLMACATSEKKQTASRDMIDASPGVHKLADEAEAKGEDEIPSFNNIVCERIERTGTHRVQRVCYTVAEGDQTEREAQDKFNRLNSRNGCIADSRGAGCGNTQIHANEGPIARPPQ